MAHSKENLKRKSGHPEEHPSKPKRARDDDLDDPMEEDSQHNSDEPVAGKICKVFMRNFMCHDSMEINLNKNVNFIVGRNGSGKSAILTALTVGLGAKATVTNRGSSMKEFIKKGRNNANIEITLSNDGVNAYNPDTYGENITICRTIGTTSNYRIKNAYGKIVSTKKSELDHILSALNIQVDNPICVLNQDVSRSFLIVSDANKKYQLFMKATQLDVIHQKYRDSQNDTDDAEKKLKEAKDFLDETNKDIANLSTNLESLETVDAARKEYQEMKIEILWAKVITEEKHVRKLEGNLREAKERVEDLMANEEKKDSIEKEYDNKIKELEHQISEAVSANIEKKETFERLKKAFDVEKVEFSTKMKEFNNFQSAMERKKKDVIQFQAAVKKSQKDSSEAEANKIKNQADYEKLKALRDDLDAVLQTKQTEKKHLENDKMCVEQEKYSLKSTLDQSKINYDKVNKQLHAIKQQADQALSVYGPNIPRLLKRIEEEYAKGNFKRKPIGPLGAYIKVKDKNWIPAVENYLGAMITSFCTDNKDDAQRLSLIMREVFYGEKTPQIICSKFYDRVHDTRQKGCYHHSYSNILDAMEISDPVVANCLIDQREIECILLIQTNDEACQLLGHQQNVPQNCKRGITMAADVYYPDPNYRTYGGPRSLRARYLQVSTDQAIQTLQEELVTAAGIKQKSEQQYHAILERIRNNEVEFYSVTKTISETMSRQRDVTKKIERIEDEMNAAAIDPVSVLTKELNELQDSLKKDEELSKNLKTELDELKKVLEAKNIEWKKARLKAQSFDEEILPIKQKIIELKDSKDNLKFNSKKASDTLRQAQGKVQREESELLKQDRIVHKYTNDAEKHGPRVETKLSEREIERKMSNIITHIQTTERQCGSKEQLLAELESKQAQVLKIVETVERLNENIKKQLERLKIRRKKYATLRNQIGQKVKRAFENILNLRKYKGTIYIDHKQLSLELEVSPANDSQRKTNDAKTLSGGERSYSTVAFILALWDCTGLPFYFLDEFDVFMDKINRRVIMDILLEHTKLYPNRQFGFLTPLDTSHILADNYVSIHQLAPPEREGEEQN